MLVTRCSRGQFESVGDSFHLFPISQLFSSFLCRHGRYPIGHVIKKHPSDPDEELSRYGDSRSFTASQALQLQVLQPDRRIFRDEYPGALHEIGPYPLVAASGDSALARSLSCRVLGRGETYIGGELLGTLKSRYVLQLHKDLYGGEPSYPGCGAEELDPVAVLHVAAEGGRPSC